ncbi:hypothetical protein COR50_07295 [Chitinophaga caeni]|uniref:DUF4397 domain-containing protein n=1 Tax=Chitinophaga caeni TaxID=2029983 RepID=A0A291QST3_9BACT|nr:hypothetical protein [Chitinophaga caeni]ATL47005.1 hypothetical protein COR50_07295 [Chitinophaga caeni]
MKKIERWSLVCFSLLGFIALLSSCTKEPALEGAVSLTIVNASTSSFIVNFNEQDTIIYASGGAYQVVQKDNSLEYILKSDYQIVNAHEIISTDPLDTWNEEAMLKVNFSMPSGAIASLFVLGAATDPDTLFVRDMPLHFQIADSSMGIRFVNLSDAKTNISINLAGQANGSEVGSLAFKGITAFNAYPADASVQQYVFEFRDASSGDLLTTATINAPGSTGATNSWRYRNFTLVFKGAPGSATTPPTAFIVKNY